MLGNLRYTKAGIAAMPCHSFPALPFLRGQKAAKGLRDAAKSTCEQSCFVGRRRDPGYSSRSETLSSLRQLCSPRVAALLLLSLCPLDMASELPPTDPYADHLPLSLRSVPHSHQSRKDLSCSRHLGRFTALSVSLAGFPRRTGEHLIEVVYRFALTEARLHQQYLQASP